MKLRHAAPLLASLAACAVAGGGPAPAPPADFAVVYGWSTGPLPPRYHYGYSVHLGPGSGGRVDFRPGYDTTVWTEPFPVTEAQLAALYAALREHGVFDREWRGATPPVGGRVESLEAVAGGRRVRLPAEPREDERAALREVYAAVGALVPPELLRALVERRERAAQEREP